MRWSNWASNRCVHLAAIVGSWTYGTYSGRCGPLFAIDAGTWLQHARVGVSTSSHAVEIPRMGTSRDSKPAQRVAASHQHQSVTTGFESVIRNAIMAFDDVH